MTAEWVYNGHDLNTSGTYRTYAVSGVDALPPKRGGNVLIPLQPGTLWVPKFHDEHIVTLAHDVQGTSYANTQSNIDTLKGYLFSATNALLVHNRPDAVVLQGYAEITQLTDFIWNGPKLAIATADYVLNDPYWRSPTKTSTTVTINASPKTFNVTNAGTAQERKCIITLTQPHATPIVITNTTNGVSVTLSKTLSGSDVVVIDCGLFTCTKTALNDYLQYLTHFGDPSFMVLEPGVNAFSVTSGGSPSTGTILFESYAPSL
jgi:phage-related protein